MIFILFLLQIVLVVCGNNSIQQNEEQMSVKCLIQFCKDYFGEQIVLSLPPYHGGSYRSQVSRDIRDTFRAQDATDCEGILLQGTSYIWSVVCAYLR
jgi:hypothetical protein